MKRIGFIGCGNMGGALAKAAAGQLKEQVLVYDPTVEKTAALQKELGVTVTDAYTIAKTASFVVLGVKPQNIEEVLFGLRSALAENSSPVIVSMAAGVSIGAVQKFAGGEYPVIRIMPNTPCMLGAGAVLYATAGVSKECENEFLSIMQNAGEFFPMDESLIDAAGALSGLFIRKRACFGRGKAWRRQRNSHSFGGADNDRRRRNVACLRRSD